MIERLRRVLLIAFGTISVGSIAAASTGDFGSVAVIEDVSGQIHSGALLLLTVCREGAKAFLQCHGDEYQGVVVFTAKSLSVIQNAPLAAPVRNAIDGIGVDPFDLRVGFGNPSTLEHCASIGDLSRVPDDPDDSVDLLLGLSSGLTGVELVGHEYGHHWLFHGVYDKADGQGVRMLLLGSTNQQPTSHYSYMVNSGSVMNGNFITDNGGSFVVSGGVRKYSQLDQYFMGLRPPANVAPFFFVDEGTGEGVEAQPLAAGSSHGASGIRVDVTIEDMVRALGPRNPPADQSPHTFKVAFVLVTEGGVDASVDQIQKVDAYRRRFQGWFPVATDGLGQIDTTLGTNTCGTPVIDAGVRDSGGIDTGNAGNTGNTGSDSGGAWDGGTEGTDAGETRDIGEIRTVYADASVKGDSEARVLEIDDCSCSSVRARPGVGPRSSRGSIPSIIGLAMIVLVVLFRRERRVHQRRGSVEMYFSTSAR